MLAAPSPPEKASAISQRPLQGEKWLIPNKSGAIWRINPSTSATQQHTDGYALLHCCCLISICISYCFPGHPVKCHTVTRRWERASRRWTHLSTCKSPLLPPFYTYCSESSCVILLTQSGKSLHEPASIESRGAAPLINSPELWKWTLVSKPFK